MQKETKPGWNRAMLGPCGIGVLAGIVPDLFLSFEPRTFASGLIEPEVWQAQTDRAVTTIAKLRTIPAHSARSERVRRNNRHGRFAPTLDWVCCL